MNVGYYVASAFFVPFSLHPNSEYACQFVCGFRNIYPVIRAFAIVKSFQTKADLGF